MTVPIIGGKREEVTLESGVVVPKEVAVEFSPFSIGELFCIKGIWFKVKEVLEKELHLEITGELSSKAKKRRKKIGR
jgi:hypothetical protein